MQWPTVILLGCGLLVVAWLWRGGYLLASSVERGPKRRIGSDELPFGIFDIGAMLVIMFGGLSLAGLILPGSPADMGETDFAWRIILMQLLGQGTVVIYLLIRASLGGGIASTGLTTARLASQLANGIKVAVPTIVLVLATLSAVVTVARAMDITTPMVGHELLERMMEGESPLARALLIFSALVLAPVLEEVMYRGLLQSALQSATHWQMRRGVIVLSAVIFSVIHAGPATFDSSATGGVPWQALIGLIVLAIVLGGLYERTGKLLACIVVHSLFNATNVLLVLLMPQQFV